MAKILVTPRSLTRGGHPALADLEQAGCQIVMCTPGETPTEEELMRLLPDCDGWLAGVEPVSPAVIDAAPNLRVISRYGTGIDNLPMDYLAKKGITVARTQGANARGVAELALGLALAGLRHIPATAAGVRKGQWPRQLGREIFQRTVGVIGCGAIGRTFVQLALAVGARVMAYDPLTPSIFKDDPAFAWAGIDEILDQADIVSLHCPALEDGQPLLGPRELARARPGMIIINTARASLVDETALIAALDRGQVSVYATDVFDSEPPEATPLIQHPQTIATSHIGGFTSESKDRVTQEAVANLRRALNIAETGT